MEKLNAPPTATASRTTRQRLRAARGALAAWSRGRRTLLLREGSAPPRADPVRGVGVLSDYRPPASHRARSAPPYRDPISPGLASGSARPRGTARRRGRSLSPSPCSGRTTRSRCSKRVPPPSKSRVGLSCSTIERKEQSMWPSSPRWPPAASASYLATNRSRKRSSDAGAELRAVRGERGQRARVQRRADGGAAREVGDRDVRRRVLPVHRAPAVRGGVRGRLRDERVALRRRQQRAPHARRREPPRQRERAPRARAPPACARRRAASAPAAPARSPPRARRSRANRRGLRARARTSSRIAAPVSRDARAHRASSAAQRRSLRPRPPRSQRARRRAPRQDVDCAIADARPPRRRTKSPSKKRETRGCAKTSFACGASARDPQSCAARRADARASRARRRKP